MPVDVERAPSWRSDLRAQVDVVRALRQFRPDLVSAGTPKMGLLAMIAAAGLRVPTRVHVLHGLRYETARGPMRAMIRGAQQLSCAAATHVVCVSRSLRERARETGLLGPAAGIVIGDGTVNGIDVEYFRSNAATQAAGLALRGSLGIAASAAVVGYLGRLSRDKGIGDLCEAWRAVGTAEANLLIGGQIDETDPPDTADLAYLQRAPRVRMLGYVADVRQFLAAIDVLVLPTWREGFPTVPLEAAAMGIPTIASDATGCVDAVEAGVTGAIVATRDPRALANAIDRYVADRELRALQGHAGRAWVCDRFSQARIHRLTIEFYRSILH